MLRRGAACSCGERRDRITVRMISTSRGPSPAMSNARIAAEVTWVTRRGIRPLDDPRRRSLLQRGRLRSSSASSRELRRAVVGTGDAHHLRRAPDGVPRREPRRSLDAWLVWAGLRSGAVFKLALLSIEAVVWIGFALPLPCCSGSRGSSWSRSPGGRSDNGGSLNTCAQPPSSGAPSPGRSSGNDPSSGGWVTW